MKLNFFFATVLVLFSLQAGAQNAFYDSQTLLKKDHVGPQHIISGTDIYVLPDVQNVYTILKYYVPVSDSSSKDAIVNDFKNNPFMKFGTSTSHDAVSGMVDRATSSVGGIDVTNFANGIASFLIDRAKQELTIAFFSRFKKFATDPKHPEFITLFPQTTDKLDSLLSYNYPQMLPALRTAFFSDLKQAPYNFESLLELPKYQSFMTKFPEITIVIKSLRIVRDLEDGSSNAADVIKSFATDTAFHWTDQAKSKIYRNTGTLINLTYIISESLRRDTIKNKDSIWVSGKQIKPLVTDNALATIYMGLIYQQIKNQKLMYYSASGIDTIATVFANQKKNILLFQNKIAQFISLASEVNNAIASKNAKKAAKQALTNDDYYNYINVSLDAIDYAFGMVKLIDTNFNRNNVLSIPRKANSLYKDIYSKQYTQAVSDGLDILTQVKVLVDESSNGGDKKLDSLLAFVATVKPYAIFMANVVEATSSADVEAALNNVVLPVGSYTIKQTASCNISLNGYVGYAYDINNHFQNVYAKGIYAPIGFSFSTNICKKVPVSLFIGIIDVGSVVSYQLSNGNVTTTSASGTTSSTSTSALSQQIKLGSIFSPSAQVFFEIPKWPFAIGAGWRRTPTLFYSGSAGYSTVGAQSVFNVTALIDIPLFTFHNKPYNKGSAK